jgi:hypothetical protein
MGLFLVGLVGGFTLGLLLAAILAAPGREPDCEYCHFALSPQATRSSQPLSRVSDQSVTSTSS